MYVELNEADEHEFLGKIYSYISLISLELEISSVTIPLDGGAGCAKLFNEPSPRWRLWLIDNMFAFWNMTSCCSSVEIAAAVRTIYVIFVIVVVPLDGRQVHHVTAFFDEPLDLLGFSNFFLEVIVLISPLR